MATTEVITSTNPFSDIYAAPTTHSPDSSDHQASTSIAFPNVVPVPFLDALPPMSSPNSSSSQVSTAPSTPTPQHLAIEWTNADVNYLLSTLYPDQMVAKKLIMSPLLENLQEAEYPVNLKLYMRIPPSPIPSKAYDAKMPIGTGRPISKVLLAESGRCHSPTATRRSLALALLADRRATQYIVGYYNLLASLYKLPVRFLQSVQRGMLGMSLVSEVERCGRMVQMLRAGVNEEWPLEAKLELFLLEGGSWEVWKWMGAAEVGLRLELEERKCWAAVYAEAGGFLAMALKET